MCSRQVSFPCQSLVSGRSLEMAWSPGHGYAGRVAQHGHRGSGGVFGWEMRCHRATCLLLRMCHEAQDACSILLICQYALAASLTVPTQWPAISGTCKQLARSKAPGQALRYCWIWRDTTTACATVTMRKSSRQATTTYEFLTTEGMKILPAWHLTTRHVVKGMAIRQPVDLQVQIVRKTEDVECGI